MAKNLTPLRERWERLELGSGEASTSTSSAAAAAANGVARREVFERLLVAYAGPDRHYHGIDHIDECLRELDEVRSLAKRPNAIEAAIWFHDVVYDGRRKDNEQQSAEVADAEFARLGVDATMRDEVRRLIILTRHDVEPAADDVDGRLIVDIDLASLARPPEIFDENSRRIRLEYPHVNESDFRRGRRNMLGGFLARKQIYRTATFAERYERQARENLSRVMENL